MTLRSTFAALLLAVAASTVPSKLSAQPVHITTPKEQFGANFGDDYFPGQLQTDW